MTYRQEPPRLRGLKWHDPKPYTKLEEILIIIGISASMIVSALLILSLFI